MTTLAYCAISPEGFAAPGEILMIRKNISGLKKFTQAMHDAGGMVSAQLGHAGPVAHKSITGVRPMAATQKGIFKLGVKLFGKKMLGEYPYEDLYMLESARQFQPIVKNAQLILLGGINDYIHLQIAMENDFSFVALGRALLREPDLVNKLKDKSQIEGRCIHCNKCMFTVYTTTNCVFTKEYATSSKEVI